MPSTAAIENALYAKAQAVADALSLTITYGEAGFTVPDTPYLECQIVVGEPFRGYLGSNSPHDRRYTLQLTVIAREGWPVGSMTTLASNVVDEFDVDEMVPASTPLARVMAAPHVDSLLPEDGRVMRQVRVRFQALV